MFVINLGSEKCGLIPVIYQIAYWQAKILKDSGQ